LSSIQLEITLGSSCLSIGLHWSSQHIAMLLLNLYSEHYMFLLTAQNDRHADFLLSKTRLFENAPLLCEDHNRKEDI